MSTEAPGQESFTENKSSISSRSTNTRSRGGTSAVLARAREYNRIIDQNRNRSKSYDRHSHTNNSNSNNNSRIVEEEESTQREMSPNRERAVASVQASTANINTQTHSTASNQNHQGSYRRNTTMSTSTSTSAGNPNTDGTARPAFRSSPTPSQKSAAARQNQYKHNSSHKSSKSSASSHNHQQQQQQGQHSQSHAHQQQQGQSHNQSHLSPTNPVTNKENNYRSSSSTSKQKQSHSNQHSNSNNHQQQSQQQQQQQQPQSQSQLHNNNNQQAVVTPELLVDALSGHEDGLLAIAERLMEHYDSGYDVMGEAIIDAFADVQKLFQHVVEAAHMEGAAYEAGRRDEEIEKLKKQLGNGDVNMGMGEDGLNYPIDSGGGGHQHQQHNDPQSNNNPSSPLRHEEFIDQDVRDVLGEAIRKGQGLKESHKFTECFQLFEHACNSASSLLPVDSDHRGRLQLSIARAESMTAERACAILKYVMDDVLRSGLTSNSKVVMPDPSQRGDCVLTRHPPKSRMNSDDSSSFNSKYNGVAGAGGDGVVLQSSEEALASMVEEMKEILSAPVYGNSPLQSVSERFWSSLSEAQRNNAKAEERLEQKLAELKGDFLIAKMEWEEKYSSLARESESYKKKLERLSSARYMEQARLGVNLASKDFNSDGGANGTVSTAEGTNLDSPRSGRNGSSVASFASFSHHAKSIVSSFSCSGGGNQQQQLSDRQRRNNNGGTNRINRIHGSPPYGGGSRR